MPNQIVNQNLRSIKSVFKIARERPQRSITIVLINYKRTSPQRSIKSALKLAK
jgi:hypothetical protein